MENIKDLDKYNEKIIYYSHVDKLIFTDFIDT